MIIELTKEEQTLLGDILKRAITQTWDDETISVQESFDKSTFIREIKEKLLPDFIAEQ